MPRDVLKGYLMFHRFALISMFGLAGLPALGASPFQQVYNLDDLPLLKPGVRTYQVSSHDPSGGNGDADHYVRTQGNVKVLADLKGPGVVRRIWSANPSGRLRIYLDGAAQPAVDAPFQDLFQDKVPGFHSPIAGKSSGGWYSYVPIAFRKSCLITATDANGFYYQVTWQSVPPKTVLTPFDGKSGPTGDPAYRTALKAWTTLGEEPSDTRSIKLPKRFISLPPGGKWVQPIHGPGTITSLRFAFPSSAQFSLLRQTILRISFDGGKPAVEAPLGDFMGIGFDGVQWKSLPLGVDETGAYCYFRMPFNRQARIEIENQSRSSFQASFTGSARPGVPNVPWGYFHANYHTGINVAGKNYLYGKLRGNGHVVGVTHSMRGNGNLWFLEGDEKVYVDGAAQPDVYGTGTEDFFNCGWYFNTGLVNVATHGVSHKTDNEISAWRMLMPDAIPFTRALDFHVEHGGTNDVAGSEYSSVIYWYAAAGAVDVGRAMPKGSGLLPRPFVAPIVGAIQAVDANWVTSAGGTVRKQLWQQLGSYRGAGRVVLKGRQSAEASVGLDVRFTDDYDVDLYLSGMGTASRASVIVNGERVGPVLADGPGPLPVRKVAVGPFHLSEGKHAFGLRILSGSSVSVVALRISPRSRLVHDFTVLGPFSVSAGSGVKTPLPADGHTPELARSYTVAGKTLKWTLLRAPNGLLDLAATLTPNTDAIAYAAFAVKSPINQTLPLMLGSDDGVQAWVNGKLVWTNDATRVFKLDEDRVNAPLKAGWNTVVLKVGQGMGAWAVSARFPDPEGTLRFEPFVPASS